jgi:uncharacterized phage protein gp47/JayE
VATDIQAAIPGSNPFLRFSNLNIMGVAQANLASAHYGYLDWIAKQSVPFTATDEYLFAWGALKGVIPLAATPASGSVTFPGANGSTIPDQTPVSRSDGASFITQGVGTVAGGSVTVTVLAVVAGSAGNCDTSTAMTLGIACAGVQSSGTVPAAFSNGTDDEKVDAYRSRMLQVYANPPQGGSLTDYSEWALACPGVTRAWIEPNGMGAGTVIVRVMMDITESAHGGFPQGTNGVAASDLRSVAATGDQLTVANYIFPLRPVTALVFVVAPIPDPIAFSISGVPLAYRTAVTAAIADVFFREGSPGGKVLIQHIWAAIASVSGVSDFIVTSPATDITSSTGHLPTVGTITWS